MRLFRSANHALFAILALALCLRLLALAVTDIQPVSDAADYIRLAQSLLHDGRFADNGVLTAYRLPAYPFFLSAAFALIPHQIFVQIIQIFLDLASCYFLFRIGKGFFSVQSGLLSALFWAILPSAVVQPLFLMTETLFVTLFLASLVLASSEKNWDKSRLFALGLLWGFCALVKPNFLLAPFVIPVLGFLKEREIGMRTFVRTGLVVVSMLLVLSPWIFRNYRTFGEAAISSNGGVNFWIGNNFSASGTYYFPPDNPLDSLHGEFSRNARGYELGREFIRKEPLKALMLAGKKVGYLLSLESPTAIALAHNGATSAEGMSYRDLYRQTPWFLLVLVNIPYCLLVLAGIFGLSRLHSASWFLLFFVGMWICSHIIYFGAPRFHFPLLPIFALGAASLQTPTFSARISRFIAIIAAFLLIVLWTAEIIMVFRG